MDSPLVSVIIPTYNRAYLLATTVDSVLAQTYQEFEIIIIDDGSTDQTSGLVKQRYSSEPRVKYFFQKNKGVSAARNTGLQHAKGKYIAFCDSDDIWMPYKLAVQVACFQKNPEVGLVWTDLRAVDPRREVLFERYTRVGYRTWDCFSMGELFSRKIKLSEIDLTIGAESDVYVGNIFTQMVTGTIINMPTVAVTRTRLEHTGLFDESMSTGEDYDFNLRVCSAGDVCFVDLPTIDYRIGAPDQLTRADLMIDQARNSLRTLRSIIKQHRNQIALNDSQLNKVVANRYRWLAESEFELKNYQGARTALLMSLRLMPRQLRLWLLLLMTVFPDKTIFFIRNYYQNLKSKLR